MARTIRRKRGRPIEITKLVPYSTVTGVTRYEWVDIPRGSLEFRKEYQREHRDRKPGSYSAPSWYCRQLYKRVAYAEKRAIRKGLLTPDLDVVLNPRKNNAGYSWF